MAAKRTSRSTSEKKATKSTKSPKGSAGVKMTMCTVPTIIPRAPPRDRRIDRRTLGGKRLAMARTLPGKIKAAARRSLDPCDNSNDSGLGFDHHVDHSANMATRSNWVDERSAAKKPRLNIKLEDDEINENFTFPETIRTSRENTNLIRTAPTGTVPSLTMNGNQNHTSGRAVPRCLPLVNRSSSSGPVSLITQLCHTSRYADVSLTIINQPEQQHRARYQTEGSRGAVKDRTGNGFPVVQLTGYNQPTTLQVFIGSDSGRVSPHMFYQACRVSGKNSTPCIEKKIDGTVVIELQLDPTKEMAATCDCVGILKERNVDVEHRFPEQVGSRSKKKSTKCRMVFRTTITHDNGMQETLQVCSQPIVCTQPPGVPEICKKSLTSCPATGGLELFMLGKNFLKDTRVYFQQVDNENRVRWEQTAVPDKEFLQQTHLVCVVPPYLIPDITEPVTVRLFVVSSAKTSEAHQFVYTPVNGAMASVRAEPLPPAPPFLSKMLWSSVNKQEQDFGMMPPPGTSQVPLSQRRASTNIITNGDSHSPPMRTLKQELIDESSQNSMLEEAHQSRFRRVSESSLDVQQGDSNLSMLNENSIDLLRHNSTEVAQNDGSNLTMLNENSMDVVVRRNSTSRPVVTMDAMTTLNETPLHPSQAIGNEVQMLSQAGLLTAPILSKQATVPITRDELKVMDLRMKMPSATVADLASTCAPSMATLHSLGVTEATNVPLPAQSVQSVENYLNIIEASKTINSNILAISSASLSQNSDVLNNKLAQIIQSAHEQNALYAQKLNNQVTDNLLTAKTQSLSHLSAQVQNVLNGQVPIFNTVRHNEPMTESDVLLNSVSQGMHSPQDMLMGNKSPLVSVVGQTDILTATQDIILNSQASSMIPTTLTSASLNQSEMNSHVSQTLSPEVILNSQISPSLMCRNIAPDGLLNGTNLNNICHPSPPVENIQSQQQNTNLLTTESQMLTNTTTVLTDQLNSMIGPNDPEKAILFKAAADLLETRQQLSQLDRALVSPTRTSPTTMEQHIIHDFLSTTTTTSATSAIMQNTQSQLSNAGNNFVDAQYIPATTATLHPDLLVSKSIMEDNKRDLIIPVPVKDMTGQASGEKKNDDRMIPNSFAAMSENELISIINPSCFDQGNAFH